ncbi:hypothetical protein OAR37_01560 [Flavobacteriaceae bacterium]|jgi:hypothetical protein|uniref:hypothetical protein n=1 Tax=Candidatus Arcticimaribacter forsetii TaxID=2820661 RepID=UPI00207740B0|nr:hypothetical protein [Candidatus Arcticimaribacter forsetii]MDA8639774.1 hypothetical protein [Flavobacteriaceae bacterium]MDB2325660.1 hypothetical protein [Flavobacteriaceae bacterium]MDB2329681.1 hypothetical protein [Flavobacteriaceae bacterium]MDB4609019.1 hypothetical protein [Flavobacteriaceae bacterium]MDB4620941.1 hypothetical protein [Flavobacteriaceae bacterium]
MKNNAYKKYLVLGILFVFPIVIYLFFASGINNFAKLPVLTKDIPEIERWTSLSGTPVKFNNKITILGFWGNDLEEKKGDAFNLNQKIYKRFYQFKDFQFVIAVQDSLQDEIKEIISEIEIGVGTDMVKWNFIFGTPNEIEDLFNSLKSDVILSDKQSTSTVFILDRESKLRGRDDDEDVGTLYGYNASSVASLNNKMTDDVKVILAEYRLALKKNNSNRQK